MKFDELKKARWTLDMVRKGEKEMDFLNGLFFVTNVKGKGFFVMYNDENYDDKKIFPSFVGEECVTDATHDEIISWVEQTYTSHGFKKLYEDLFIKGIIKNF